MQKNVHDIQAVFSPNDCLYYLSPQHLLTYATAKNVGCHSPPPTTNLNNRIGKRKEEKEGRPELKRTVGRAEMTNLALSRPAIWIHSPGSGRAQQTFTLMGVCSTMGVSDLVKCGHLKWKNFRDSRQIAIYLQIKTQALKSTKHMLCKSWHYPTRMKNGRTLSTISPSIGWVCLSCVLTAKACSVSNKNENISPEGDDEFAGWYELPPDLKLSLIPRQKENKTAASDVAVAHLLGDTYSLSNGDLRLGCKTG